jgi:molybdate transport system substrate-binding protein
LPGPSSSRRTRASAVALVVLVLAGCGSSSRSGGSGRQASGTAALSGSVTVFAAASLTAVLTQLGKDFEAAHPGTSVTFSFGPSSGLAQQIIAGAPADVFASASAKNMDQVVAAGDAGPSVTFANNVAQVAVSPDSAGKVASLADLAKRGVKVALCQPAAPCGALAQKVLNAAKVRVKPVTQGLDVKSTLAYVTSGQVDAAIVYVTDVRAAGSKVRGVEIPAAVNASTAYEIARVKAGANAALATAFEEFVLSPTGLSALTAAGFQKP